MKTIARTNLEDWLEMQGGFKMADYVKMPIAQTKEEEENEDPIKYVPEKGLIQFEGIGMFRHGFTHKVRCIWDYNKKVCYGVLSGSHNKSGEPKFTLINIDAAAVLDLSKPIDRKNYYTLLHDQALEGGPRAAGAPRFRIINKDQEAEKYLENRKFVIDASKLVDGMGGESMKKFAVLFGINDRDSDSVIKRQLYEKADKDPKTFISRYQSGDRAMWEVTKKAVADYVLAQKDGQFWFENIPMGINEEMVVDTLKRKPEMVQALMDAIEAKSGKKQASVMVDKKQPKNVAKPNPFQADEN